MLLHKVTFTICLFLCVKDSALVRTKQKIYVDITGYASCFRLLNGTHQFGCSSSRGGNVGVLQYVSTSTQLDWVLNKGRHAPYAVLIEPFYFNRTILKQMENSGRVNGVMLINVQNSTLYPPLSSPDNACPNEQLGYYQNKAGYSNCQRQMWNPKGSGLKFEDFSFPIMTIYNETDVNGLITMCYEKWNRPLNDTKEGDYPLCAVEMKSPMDAILNTEICMRKSDYATQSLNPVQYCDQLGDYNVHATLPTISSTDQLKNNSVIVAAARLDSFSMFENRYPSAESSIAGVVTLLAAGQILGRLQSSFTNSSNPILFSFFHGEAFDYIGSGRFVYDMKRGNYPGPPYTNFKPYTMYPRHLRAVLEVSQVGKLESRTLWAHSDPLSRSSNPLINQTVNSMVAILRSASGSDLNIHEPQNSQPLPPSSSQSFLKERLIPALVLADHGNSYHNEFYNSQYDLAANINLTYPSGLNASEKQMYISPAATTLSEVATVLARSLYQLSTGFTNHTQITVDKSTVAQLLYCFLVTPNCELSKSVINPSGLSDLGQITAPFSTYVGIRYKGQTNIVPKQYTQLVRNMLAYFVGTKTELSQTDCSNAQKNRKIYQYNWINGEKNSTTGKNENYCLRSTIRLSDAKSPAFENNNYDWKSGTFPTWTESRWGINAVQLRYFLLPERQREVTTLVIGLLVFAASFFITLFARNRFSILFYTSNDANPTSLPST